MLVEETGSKYDSYDKRVVIWPVYIDAKKTIADGRKLPTEKCVEYPTMNEMKEVIEHLGYEAAYEEKAYPRDISQFGRFRVTLKDPRSGEPTVEGITTRRQLLQKIAELIPNLKTRNDPTKGAPKPGVPGVAIPGYAETLMPVRPDELPQMQAAQGASSGGGGGSAGGSSKKKGKK